MPSYLKMSRIDWNFDAASPELRAILPEANEELSSSDHTPETFKQALKKLVAERSDLVADALIEDGFRQYWLFRARDGRLSIFEVEERPEGALEQKVTLPFDDVAIVTLVRDADGIRALLEKQSDFDGDDGDEVCLPLYYDDEASMREVVGRVALAMDEGDYRFVATVQLQRFLVEISPASSHVRRLVVVTQPDLVSRLLRAQFTGVS